MKGFGILSVGKWLRVSDICLALAVPKLELRTKPKKAFGKGNKEEMLISRERAAWLLEEPSVSSHY